MIINGRAFATGNSYAITVKKALVDANIIEEGQNYNLLLLSPQLDEDQRKFLDKLVMQVGAHMVAHGKKPEEFSFLVEDEQGSSEEFDVKGVRPRPEEDLDSRPNLKVYKDSFRAVCV